MRGFGLAFRRLPAPIAFLAGAALLAGASVNRADAQSVTAMDETAFAVPRLDPRGSSGIALPRPLPPSDAVKLARIFALQGREDMDTAGRELAGLDIASPLARDMLGHLLAQRYLGRTTRPSADELLAWLKAYPTLPDAPALHALLLTRLPTGMTPPPVPVQPGLAEGGAPALGPVPEESEPANFTFARNPMLDRSVHDTARARGADGVEKLLASTSGLCLAVARRGSANSVHPEPRW